METKFHLSIPIKNLYKTKEFYVNILGCSLGRESSSWLDINFFGHQITAVVNPDMVISSNFYGGKRIEVPTRHFGVVLSWDDWFVMKDKLLSNNTNFAIEPQLMFQDQIGEQMSFFLEDPNGYALEFKAFETDDYLFRKK